MAASPQREARASGTIPGTLALALAWRCGLAASRPSYLNGIRVRDLLCEAPFGPFRQKVPDPFFVGRPGTEARPTMLAVPLGRSAQRIRGAAGRQPSRTLAQHPRYTALMARVSRTP